MARYILLAIEDNKDADDLVANIERGLMVVNEKTSMWRVYPEVVGVWFKPTQFCECPRGALQMSRGQKFGAWVHKCGKPIRGFWQHPRNLHRTDELSSYEQGLYLGIVEPRDGKMPVLDHKARGRAIGITR